MMPRLTDLLDEISLVRRLLAGVPGLLEIEIGAVTQRRPDILRRWNHREFPIHGPGAGARGCGWDQPV